MEGSALAVSETANIIFHNTKIEYLCVDMIHLHMTTLHVNTGCSVIGCNRQVEFTPLHFMIFH